MSGTQGARQLGAMQGGHKWVCCCCSCCSQYPRMPPVVGACGCGVCMQDKRRKEQQHGGMGLNVGGVMQQAQGRSTGGGEPEFSRPA